jgi:hypothetical protein
MITLTERAKQVLSTLRESVEAPVADMGLRLAPDASGQLELFADTPREGDRIVEHAGTILLLVSGDILRELAGATMDCQMTPNGPKLVVKRASGGRAQQDPGRRPRTTTRRRADALARAR